jgi:hypothetical protein
MNRLRLLSAALLAALSLTLHGSGQLADETHPRTQGTATLPNGRQITPVGDWITVAPFSFSLALRPDGRQLVVPSMGFPFALNLIDNPAAANHGPPGRFARI